MLAREALIVLAKPSRGKPRAAKVLKEGQTKQAKNKPAFTVTAKFGPMKHSLSHNKFCTLSYYSAAYMVRCQ